MLVRLDDQRSALSTKTTPFSATDLGLGCAAPSRTLGWTCGLRSPSWIGLELGLVLRSPVALTGLVVGLGLRSPSLIGLGLGLGLQSPTRNWTWTSGPENRTLVKPAAAESDFGFGLGLRALPCRRYDQRHAVALLRD